MSPNPLESNSWEEELKRQCEIRHLPYSEVNYLVTEIVSSSQNKLVEEIKEEVRKMKEKEPPHAGYSRVEASMYSYAKGANLIVDKVLALLASKQEKE